MKLPLVSVTKTPDAKAHPYPFQIAMQTQRFIQGSVFYSALSDFGAGKFFNTPNAYEIAKKGFISTGLSESNWEISWKCVEEYTKMFPSPVIQGALYYMNVHWDWFMVQIGKFIEFGRNYNANPPIDQKVKKKLSRIGFEKLSGQIQLLSDATGLEFEIPQAIMETVDEMILVRNLGIHNEWVVDKYYLERTKNKNWAVGVIRIFTIAELLEWLKGLIQIIDVITTKVAIKYVVAPEFKP